MKINVAELLATTKKRHETREVVQQAEYMICTWKAWAQPAAPYSFQDLPGETTEQTE